MAIVSGNWFEKYRPPCLSLWLAIISKSLVCGFSALFERHIACHSRVGKFSKSSHLGLKMCIVHKAQQEVRDEGSHR